MVQLLIDLSKDKSGATAIEYGLIVTMIVIAMITSLSAVADETTNLWTTVKDKSAEAIAAN